MDRSQAQLKIGLALEQMARGAVATALGVRALQVDRWVRGLDAIPSEVEEAIDALIVPSVPRTVRPSFKFIDLFAGIGGIRQAFQAQGGECVFTAEWNEFSRRTYQVNFGSDHPVIGDIRGKADLVPAHDVLLAGFPCQPFSIAGVSKKNSLGRPHGFEDPTQGTLFFEIKEILKARKPSAFILENVKNLPSHDKGRTFAVILNTLEELGYQVHARVIDGGHYRPQHRERIVIVGFAEKVQFDFDELRLNERPVTAQKIESILHKTDGTEPFLPYDGDRYFDRLSHRVQDKFTLRPNLWEYLQNYAAKHKAAGNGFGYGLVTAGGRTRTLSARYHKDGSEILIDQGPGAIPRRLTPRECARLMGFPDSYVIPVSDTQAYRQFGNSVVVPMFEAIAELVVPRLELIRRAKQRRQAAELSAQFGADLVDLHPAAETVLEAAEEGLTAARAS